MMIYYEEYLDQNGHLGTLFSVFAPLPRVSLLDQASKIGETAFLFPMVVIIASAVLLAARPSSSPVLLPFRGSQIIGQVSLSLIALWFCSTQQWSDAQRIRDQFIDMSSSTRFVICIEQSSRRRVTSGLPSCQSPRAPVPEPPRIFCYHKQVPVIRHPRRQKHALFLTSKRTSTLPSEHSKPWKPQKPVTLRIPISSRPSSPEAPTAHQTSNMSTPKTEYLLFLHSTSSPPASSSTYRQRSIRSSKTTWSTPTLPSQTALALLPEIQTNISVSHQHTNLEVFRRAHLSPSIKQLYSILSYPALVV